jgi:hypothetical protein
MKIRMAHVFVCAGAAMIFAAAAIGQDAAAPAATQPSAMDVPTSRPSMTQQRFEGRTQRRSRRGTQQQGSGGFGGSSAPAAQPLSEQVGSRNIFIRGNQQVREEIVNQSQNAANYQSSMQAQQEADLVFTGVSLADNGKIALVENHTDYSVQRVKIGDPIAYGKVVAMTLDTLDYQNKAGRIIRVGIGNNLAGGDVAGVVGGTTSGTASTQPSKAGPRLPGESMEDYLKRRRAAEVAR